MKKMIFIASLSFCLVSTIQADNGLGSLTDQLNAITKSAFAETSRQMALKVNLSGKQRMLTQKMAKESLLIGLKIDAQENKKNLEKTAKLFEKTLKGLQVGDKSLGLTRTTNKDILKQFDKVTALWKEFKPNVESIYQDGVSVIMLQNIATKNIPLLIEMNKVVGMYEKSSGADLNKLATVINLSGKQRMLTQKMSKELLLVAEGIDKEKNRKNLKGSMMLFEKTLKGLVSGDADLGLPETKDKKILAQLLKVETLWGEFKPVMDKADTSGESLKKMATLNLPLLKEMNKVVKMYELQSK